jgi:hypothetical protein
VVHLLVSMALPLKSSLKTRFHPVPGEFSKIRGSSSSSCGRQVYRRQTPDVLVRPRMTCANEANLLDNEDVSCMESPLLRVSDRLDMRWAKSNISLALFHEDLRKKNESFHRVMGKNVKKTARPTS